MNHNLNQKESISNGILLVGSDISAKSKLSKILQSQQLLYFPFSTTSSSMPVCNQWQYVQEKKNLSLVLVLDYQQIFFSDELYFEDLQQKQQQMNTYLVSQIENLQKYIINLQELLEYETILIIIVDENNRGERIRDFLTIQKSLYDVYWKVADKKNILYLKFLVYLMEKIPNSFYINPSYNSLESNKIIQKIQEEFLQKQNIILRMPNEAIVLYINRIKKLIQECQYNSIAILFKEFEQMADTNTINQLTSNIIAQIDTKSSTFNCMIQDIQKDIEIYQNIGLFKLKEYLYLIEIITKFQETEFYSRDLIIKIVKEILECELKKIQSKQNNLNKNQFCIFQEFASTFQELEFIFTKIKQFQNDTQKQLLCQAIQLLEQLKTEQLQNVLQEFDKLDEKEIMSSNIYVREKQQIENIIQKHLEFMKNLFDNQKFENQINLMTNLDETINNLNQVCSTITALSLLCSKTIIIQIIDIDKPLINDIKSITEQWQETKKKLKQQLDEKQQNLDENSDSKQILNFFEKEKNLNSIYQSLGGDLYVNQGKKEKILQNITKNYVNQIDTYINKCNFDKKFINDFQFLERIEKLQQKKENLETIVDKFTKYTNGLTNKLKTCRDQKKNLDLLNSIQQIKILKNLKLTDPILKVVNDFEIECQSLK